MSSRIIHFPDDLFDPKKMGKESMWDCSNITVMDNTTGLTWNAYYNNADIRVRLAAETLMDKYGIEEYDWKAFIDLQEEAVRINNDR